MTQIASVLDGKYEILKQIGQGGMSVVYLAMDIRLNKQWAIKEVKKQANDQNKAIIVQGMITEANLIKKLDHPALPRIVDIIDTGQTLYIVMDYIEGEPLDRILNEYGAQPQELVIEWAKQLCDVLDYLHTRKPPIIYRDIKPSNVMMKPEGNVKLIDFGIAREYKETNLADTVSLGTKGYAAPEQFGGKGQTDARTDVYCLGATLYHLVTGHNPTAPPYEMYPIRQWNPALSGGLERIIKKCTILNPDDRYQSCAELMYALEHYEQVDDIYRKKQKRKLASFIISAGLTIAVGIASLVFFFLSFQTRTADYNHRVEIGQYIEAIKIDPSKKPAYLDLIKMYKSDSHFSDDEANTIRTLENNKDVDALKRDQESYAEVCYQIATAYWFYTESDQATHAEATKWFGNVVNVDQKFLSAPRKADWEMANILEKIGRFYKNEVIWNKEGGADANAYSDYWSNINDFLNRDNGENEFVSMKIMNEVIKESVHRQKKLNNEGITNQQIADMIVVVQGKLSRISSQNADILGQKDNLLQLCETQLKLLR